jgi:hypothetical protein
VTRLPRQGWKNGLEHDWISRRARRMLAFIHRPGMGRFIKRQLAKRRRREPIPED